MNSFSNRPQSSQTPARLPHTLNLENRENLLLTGIVEVLGFDETNLMLETTLGVLAIDGQGLHIAKLNVDNGEMHVEGRIVGLYYIDKTEKPKRKLFGRESR